MPQAIACGFLRPAMEPPNAEEHQRAIGGLYGNTIMILRGKLNSPTEAAQAMPIGIKAA